MHALLRPHGARTAALAGVSVVICARSAHRWDALVETVAAVEDQNPAPQEILIVVDHDDELLALANRALPHTRVIANEQDRGLTGVRKTGMRHANGDVVAFLDDDAATGPGWLRSLTGMAIRALPQARLIANGYDRGERGVRKTGMRHAGDDIVELLEAC